MTLRTEYEFLFVGRDEGSFLENYAYDLTEEHGEKGGQIFLTIEIQGNGVDAESIAEGIFDAMRKTFFADLEKDPYLRFEEGVKAVNQWLERCRAEKSSRYLGTIHAVIGARVGAQFTVTQMGDSEAYLVRKRYVSSLTEGLYEGGENFTNIASGKLESSDTVIFSSTRLLRYISKTDFVHLLSKPELSRALSDLKDALSTEVLGKVAILGVNVEEEPSEEEEPRQGGIPIRSPSHIMETLGAYLGTGIMEKVKKLFGKFAGVPGIEGVKDTFGDLKSRITEKWSGRPGSAGKKQKILVAFIVVLALLIGGAAFVKVRAESRAKIVAFEDELNRVQEQALDAETKGQFDKQLAGQMLEVAETKAMEILNSGYHRSKANAVLTQIGEVRDRLDNIKRLDPKIVADISDKVSDVNLIGLIDLNSRLFAYDQNRLFEIIVQKIEGPIAMDDMEVTIGGTNFDERSTLVFLTKSGKLFEYKDASATPMQTADGQFHKAVAVEDWSNRVYLLDPESNQIWRYSYANTRERFGAGEKYNQNADLRTAVDLAIDVAIYVLDQDGTITKLLGGQKQDLTIVKKPFSKPKQATRIVTEAESNPLLILDSGAGKIFYYLKDDKTGTLIYNGQLVLNGVSDLRDLAFEKNTNKLYVMDAKRVYEVAL